MEISIPLVRTLIASQFPQWADLPITPVAKSGWDHRTFHLGSALSVRLPSQACYAPQVQKEWQWLPFLQKQMCTSISQPLGLGLPNEGFPWHWGIYQWLEGKAVRDQRDFPKIALAEDLAHFLKELHKIPTTCGPRPGEHNFFRGGALQVYHKEVEHALSRLKGQIDTSKARSIWQQALASAWEAGPVWVHGDISVGNLLAQDGRLCACIDFGLLSIGDPACDLVMAWTFFDQESRDLFRNRLDLDQKTWERAKGWALWKALITEAKPNSGPSLEKKQSQRVLQALLNGKEDV